jgi:hypothetical protein
MSNQSLHPTSPHLLTSPHSTSTRLARGVQPVASCAAPWKRATCILQIALPQQIDQTPLPTCQIPAPRCTLCAAPPRVRPYPDWQTVGPEGRRCRLALGSQPHTRRISPRSSHMSGRHPPAAAHSNAIRFPTQKPASCRARTHAR